MIQLSGADQIRNFIAGAVGDRRSQQLKKYDQRRHITEYRYAVDTDEPADKKQVYDRTDRL